MIKKSGRIRNKNIIDFCRIELLKLLIYFHIDIYFQNKAYNQSKRIQKIDCCLLNAE